MLELTIISAETKKIQLEELEAKRELEEMIFLAERNKRVEKMVEAMFTQISKKIEASEFSWVEYLIMGKDLDKIHFSNTLGEFDEAMDIVQEIPSKMISPKSFKRCSNSTTLCFADFPACVCTEILRSNSEMEPTSL